MDINQLIPAIVSLLVTLSLILIFDYLFHKKNLFSRERVIQQIIYILIIVIGLLLTIFTLPINVEDKNLVLTFVSIVIGAIITFSSTTFVANAMAGIMLRMINPFRVGDFIKTDGTFGRVTEIYFLHTQVQSIDRDLITIPNLTLVSKPLKTIRSSGTIITTSVSLGYNIPRKEIEKSLLQAAETTGLENPFVHVEKLGDFSISYKVGGLLKDVERIITTRSDFKKNVIDGLHNSDIEIVSPTYMNQRVFSEDYVCMPPKEDTRKAPKEKEPEVRTEDIIFDKAIMAQMLDRIYTIAEKLPDRRKDMEDKIKDISNENKMDELKEQINILAKKEEDINPEVQALRDLPDITSMPDDKDDEYIEKLVTAEKDITLLDNRHEDLEKKIFKALEQE
ncbi:mechanosensitive ion channel [Methanolobus sediminis]|uniref:Mechanosensitive ion channel n=1 Tax=Methanolobus sediminis TaxID=3072978 RepID=A0AA51UMR8_9EURY|nr:mechanosensitive ion channel domain-containing protein [Methanolobus sediminis]WMW24860.1 mechanosensitive ion channel [Methanolobus sediminis]